MGQLSSSPSTTTAATQLQAGVRTFFEVNNEKPDLVPVEHSVNNCICKGASAYGRSENQEGCDNLCSTMWTSKVIDSTRPDIEFDVYCGAVGRRVECVGDGFKGKAKKESACDGLCNAFWKNEDYGYRSCRGPWRQGKRDYDLACKERFETKFKEHVLPYDPSDTTGCFHNEGGTGDACIRESFTCNERVDIGSDKEIVKDNDTCTIACRDNIPCSIRSVSTGDCEWSGCVKDQQGENEDMICREQTQAEICQKLRYYECEGNNNCVLENWVCTAKK